MAAEATMTAKGSKRGARVLSVALLAAIGAYLADRVMLFTTPPPAVPGASAAQTLAPAYDRQRLLQTTLFGTAAAPSNAGPVVNAPETRLALTLHGLFSGNSESSALISAAGGQPRRYLERASYLGERCSRRSKRIKCFSDARASSRSSVFRRAQLPQAFVPRARVPPPPAPYSPLSRRPCREFRIRAGPGTLAQIRPRPGSAA